MYIKKKRWPPTPGDIKASKQPGSGYTLITKTASVVRQPGTTLCVFWKADVSVLFSSEARGARAEVPIRFLNPPGVQAAARRDCSRSLRTWVLLFLSFQDTGSDQSCLSYLPLGQGPGSHSATPRMAVSFWAAYFREELDINAHPGLRVTSCQEAVADCACACRLKGSPVSRSYFYSAALTYPKFSPSLLLVVKNK